MQNTIAASGITVSGRQTQEVFVDNGNTSSFLFTISFFSFLVKIWNNYHKTNKLDQKRWKINRYYSHFYQKTMTTRSLISSIPWLLQQQIINYQMYLTLQMHWMVCKCYNQPSWTSPVVIPMGREKMGPDLFQICVHFLKNVVIPPGCPNKPIFRGTVKRQK